MRKKVLAIVTAAVLALGCFATVSAADLDPANITESAKDAIQEGSMTINGLKPNAAQKKAVKAIWEGKIFNLGGMSLLYTKAGNDDFQIKAVNWNAAEKLANVTHLYAQHTDKVIRIFEIIADADKSNPVAVKIIDSDIKTSKNYALFHFNKGEWDTTSAKVTSVAPGILKAELTDASPFALVEAKAATTNNTTTEAAKAATGTKTAPKTGEV